MGLDKIRQEIDRIDVQMRELFLERMDLSRQVAEEKLRTGGSVYAPKRERDVLRKRTDGVAEELRQECQAFFGHIMGISRTYQYSKMTERAALKELPDGMGEIWLQFYCGSENPKVSASLDALSLADINIEEISMQQREDGEYVCRLRLRGDFSQPLAKAAALQLSEENQNLMIEKVR